jgi:hypothetical protein
MLSARKDSVGFVGQGVMRMNMAETRTAQACAWAVLVVQCSGAADQRFMMVMFWTLLP